MKKVRNLLQCLLAFTFLLTPATLLAVPADLQRAQSAARGWLKHNQNPMGERIGQEFAGATEYVDDTGLVLYYVINLNPEGFVVLSADDAIEPVIAFSSSGAFIDDNNNPLKTMLEKDMRGRLEVVAQKAGGSVEQAANASVSKWDSLLKMAGDSGDVDPMVQEGDIAPAGIGTVSTVYVDPLIQSRWDQGTVSGSPCYNYYTPNNYPAGCVATAMAQVMRYYSWPVVGIGSSAFTITVNGVSQTAWTRGGNGSGGPYDWTQMPYNPQAGVTTAQRQAIGALCYDAGVAVGMGYAGGASGASFATADQRLTGTFLYGGSIYTQSFTSSGDQRLWNILNANLDAQMPVMLGISRTGGGHAVVADGYGYNDGTLYHHINMGWGGSDNAWYQLPLINASYTYTVIDDCVYNIYTSGSGEIISGRVTNLAGAPLEGVTVCAYQGTSLIKETTTNSRGIYALTQLASDTTFRISPIKTGESFLDQTVTTGSSADWGTPGNRSGISFEAVNSGPPTAYDVQAQVQSMASVAILLSAVDDNRPDPNLLRYVITSLPAHGTLSEPNVGPILGVPYVMHSSDSDQVVYQPCVYFGGQDTFTYKANDGGTPPAGGDSNTATVTVTVNNQYNVDFGTDSTSNLLGMMMNTNSYYDARSQVIYLAGEIGSAKRLTDLSLKVGQVPGRTLTKWTIRMKHTAKAQFQNAAYELETSGWTTVYQSNVTLTAGWVNFHFTTPFQYDGTQNLMVDFSFNNSGTSFPAGGYAYKLVSAKRSYSVASNTGAHGDPLTWSDWFSKNYSWDDRIPSIKLIGASSVDPIPGDIDLSCSVQLPDAAIFAQAWQTAVGQENYNAACDLTVVKGTIDLQDLVLMSNHWLETYP